MRQERKRTEWREDQDGGAVEGPLEANEGGGEEALVETRLSFDKLTRGYGSFSATLSNTSTKVSLHPERVHRTDFKLSS